MFRLCSPFLHAPSSIRRSAHGSDQHRKQSGGPLEASKRLPSRCWILVGSQSQKPRFILKSHIRRATDPNTDRWANRHWWLVQHHLADRRLSENVGAYQVRVSATKTGYETGQAQATFQVSTGYLTTTSTQTVTVYATSTTVIPVYSTTLIPKTTTVTKTQTLTTTQKSVITTLSTATLTSRPS